MVYSDILWSNSLCEYQVHVFLRVVYVVYPFCVGLNKLLFYEYIDIWIEPKNVVDSVFVVTLFAIKWAPGHQNINR